MVLLRRTGIATLMRLRASVEAGETAMPAALEGAWRILAGILLVVPGFFSSALALLLLLPPVQAVLTLLAARWVRSGGGGWTMVAGSAIRRESRHDHHRRRVPRADPEATGTPTAALRRAAGIVFIRR